MVQNEEGLHDENRLEMVEMLLIEPNAEDPFPHIAQVMSTMSIRGGVSKRTDRLRPPDK